MADINLKTETPDSTITTSAFVFGADSQSAAKPSVYQVATVHAVSPSTVITAPALGAL